VKTGSVTPTLPAGITVITIITAIIIDTTFIEYKKPSAI
jgi:hypothetical protein